MNIVKITIEEFVNTIYDRYIKLFPEDEQRDWNNIEKNYDLGIENFYKIVDDNKTIGFFMLERIKDYPYYCDYFAIYEEYQNKGYGSKAWEKSKEKIGNIGLVGEIEEVKEDNIITVRRFDFYKKLGFKRIDSLYLLYDVYYEPVIVNCDLSKKTTDKILMDYYLINCGEEEVKKNCKFIK